jgi:hypothetical protein
VVPEQYQSDFLMSRTFPQFCHNIKVIVTELFLKSSFSEGLNPFFLVEPLKVEIQHRTICN